jgi:hypothetical protein
MSYELYRFSQYRLAKQKVLARSSKLAAHSFFKIFLALE